MPHKVTYNLKTHIVESEIYGILSLNESIELISSIGQVCAENNCSLCLSDYRKATLDLSILELYDIPKRLTNILDSLGLSAHKIKRAIVVSENTKDFHFYETVTLNNGQIIKLFQDINEAQKWLLEK
jgi:hypothetical protein